MFLMSNRIDKTLDKRFLKFTPYIKYFILHIGIAQVKYMLLIWNRMIETKTQTLSMSHPLQQIYLRTIKFSQKEMEYNKRKLGNSVLPKGWIKSPFILYPLFCASVHLSVHAIYTRDWGRTQAGFHCCMCKG